MKGQCSLCQKQHSRILYGLCPSCLKMAKMYVALGELYRLLQEPEPFIEAITRYGNRANQLMRTLQGEQPDAAS